MVLSRPYTAVRAPPLPPRGDPINSTPGNTTELTRAIGPASKPGPSCPSVRSTRGGRPDEPRPPPRRLPGDVEDGTRRPPVRTLTRRACQAPIVYTSGSAQLTRVPPERATAYKPFLSARLQLMLQPP
ncbi:hypothetical protein MRX96_004738 [Rhipicephalus microplus]